MTRVGDKPSTPPAPAVVSKPISVEDIQPAAETVLETADAIAGAQDQFDVAKSAFAVAKEFASGTKMANRLRSLGAALGVANELAPGGIKLAAISPKVIEASGKVMGVAAAALNSPIGKLAREGLQVAGAISIAYSAVTAYQDEAFKTKGGKIASAVATAAVGAAAFIPGAGEIILAAEVLSGGGVTGGVKGLVSLVESGITGDKSGINTWVEQARGGDHGWVVEKLANNDTVSKVAEKFSGAVTDTIQGAMEIGKGVAAVSDAVSTGWDSFKSWAF